MLMVERFEIAPRLPTKPWRNVLEINRKSQDGKNCPF
jgi:hypothetical protein